MGQHAAQHLVQGQLLLDLPPPLVLFHKCNLLCRPRRELAAEQHDVRLGSVYGVVHPPVTRTEDWLRFLQRAQHHAHL